MLRSNARILYRVVRPWMHACMYKGRCNWLLVFVADDGMEFLLMRYTHFRFVSVYSLFISLKWETVHRLNSEKKNKIRNIYLKFSSYVSAVWTVRATKLYNNVSMSVRHMALATYSTAAARAECHVLNSLTSRENTIHRHENEMNIHAPKCASMYFTTTTY